MCRYLDLEKELGKRLVFQNDSFVALVPFWAVWPFETLLLPRRHVLRMPDLSEVERRALAEILKRLTAGLVDKRVKPLAKQFAGRVKAVLVRRAQLLPSDPHSSRRRLLNTRSFDLDSIVDISNRQPNAPCRSVR